MTPKESGFSILHGKGFYITFENGVTVSVQFGPSNYCEHSEGALIMGFDAPKKADQWNSKDAEIAMWDKSENWITKEWEDHGDDVIGYLTPEKVLEDLIWAKGRKS